MKPSTVKHLLDYRYEDAWSDWRWQMRSRIETATELLESSPSLRDRIPSERISEWIEREFRFGVTPYYLSLADFQDPLCPILRQILPDEAEISDSLFENPHFAGFHDPSHFLHASAQRIERPIQFFLTVGIGNADPWD